MKSRYYIIGAIVLTLVLLFTLSGAKSFESIENFEGEIVTYKSQSCGCCGLWYSYFKNQGNSDIKLNTVETMSPRQNIDDIKDELGVPETLRSCHTTTIGDYFVEGHIPLEAIDKLLLEMPDIKGIAMPGMPVGSPGMPGVKRGDFIIYSVNHDGTFQEFMRI